MTLFKKVTIVPPYWKPQAKLAAMNHLENQAKHRQHTHNHTHVQFITLLKCEGSGGFWMMLNVGIDVKGLYSRKWDQEKIPSYKLEKAFRAEWRRRQYVWMGVEGGTRVPVEGVTQKCSFHVLGMKFNFIQSVEMNEANIKSADWQTHGQQACEKMLTSLIIREMQIKSPVSPPVC